MKKIIILLVLILFNHILLIHSQTTDLNPWIGIEKSYIPDFKSPEVAGFMRHGSYPVNQAVGIPDITIPIYTIKSGELSFPVTLSYHLGGIKVNDIASWVGLGWSLNTNGYINRTLKGSPDENGFLNKSKFTLKDNTGNLINGTIPISEDDFGKYAGKGTAYQEMKYYLERIQNDIYDGQSDVYSYQANNISGSFMYNLDREIVQIPSSDNRIVRNANNTFTITSDNGTQYIFNDTETTNYIREINNGTHVSNWLLSYIISANNTDTIKFNYTTLTSYEDNSYSTSLTEGYAIYTCPQGNVPICYNERFGFIDKISKGSGSFSNERLLSSIEFSNGIIDFNITDRNIKDKRKYKLESIVIWNKNQKRQKGEQIKKIIFDYNNFLAQTLPSPFQNTPTDRLTLSQLKIYGQNNLSNPELYKFTYIGSALPPYGVGGGNYKFNGQDYWGYYNGVTTNENLVGVVPDGALTKHWSANREPSESHMKNGCLERIDYPTGGYTIFKTEANRDSQNKIYGGLRIAQIISKPSDTENPIIQTFTYEEPEVLFTPSVNLYRYNMHTYVRLNPGDTPEPKYRTFYTEYPFSAVGTYMGSSVIYKKVIKTETDNTGNNIGKVIYNYQGNSTFKYLSSENYIDGARESYYMPITWQIGKPLQEQYFVRGKDNPVRTIEYEYTVYQTKYNNSNNIPVGKMVLNRYFSVYPIEVPIDVDKVDSRSDFACYWIYTNTGCQKLTKVIESNYDEKSSQYITSIVNYKFDNINSSSVNKNLLISEKVVEINNNDKLIEKYTYPQNYSTMPIYANMISKNMLSYPVEQVISRNAKEISKRKREYGYAPLIYPVSEQSSFGGNAYRSDIIYNKYDIKGNIQYTTTLDGMNTVYIWSYNGQYPLAEIKNATYSQVSAIINETTLSSITSKIEPSVSDLVLISSLRTSLPSTSINIYAYKPLIGMLTATNPSGLSTHYEYDAFGRLRWIKDDQYNNISFNEYKFKNQAIPQDPATLGALSLGYFSGNLTCAPNTDQTYSLTVSGGSGNYTYKWIIKDASGNIIKEENNTNGKITINFTSMGNQVLTCTVRDRDLSQSVSVTKDIQVKQLVEFKNSKTTSVNSYTSKVTADLSCPSATTITFELKFNIVDCTYNYNRYAEFKIGGNTYKFYEETNKTVELALPAGITNVEITVSDSAGCGGGYGNLKIQSLKNSSYGIGISNVTISFIN